MRTRVLFALLFSLGLLATARADADERFCDASSTNCRTNQGQGLLDLINNETQAIDVGVWFFKDNRFVTGLVNAKKRGVAIRIVMDPRANASYPANGPALDTLQAAGIPMRKRIAGDICHWKLMIFAGQGVVEWSGANFSPTAFVPQDPYRDYEDEVIYFSQALLPSFQTMFDNIWTNTKEYANYANVPPTLLRNYPTSPLDRRLNFPPKDSYQNRLIPLIDQEPANGLIDVDMYRITMARPVDALIRAAARGVRIRLYLEPMEYTNTARPGNKVQMDRLVAASQQYPGTIEIRMRKHLGLNHQKTVWLHAQNVVVFGTSNWSDASDDNQLEANIFTEAVPGDPLNGQIFDELYRVFERKWFNMAPNGAIETEAWRTPSLPPPAESDTCLDPKATNVGGPLPCSYPPPPPPPPPPPSGATTIVLYASSATPSGTWQVIADSTAAGGTAMWNPDAAKAKIAPALASPANFFETQFFAMSGAAYHIWIRMRAQNNSASNDSVHVQFSDAVTELNGTTPTMQIGSTSSAELILQDGPSGGADSNWGWTDNGWGVPGNFIYFATTGLHRLRVQQREDGAIVDQIVLSPTGYIVNAPGPHQDDQTILPATPPESGSCTYTLSSAGGSIAAAGGDGSVGVVAESSCSWSATTTASWIAVTSGSGTGNGTATYTVQQNPGEARTGTLSIQGQVFTVTQEAAFTASTEPCPVTLDKTSLSVGSAEANWTINVTAALDCAWIASADAAWLVVKSTGPTPQPVGGSGYVKVRALANTTARRTGHFVVNGVVYTVTQGAGGL